MNVYWVAAAGTKAALVGSRPCIFTFRHNASSHVSTAVTISDTDVTRGYPVFTRSYIKLMTLNKTKQSQPERCQAEKKGLK